VKPQRHPNLRALVVGFAMLLIASACGSSSTDATVTSTADTAATGPQTEASAPAEPVPSPLLTGEFASITGDSINLADFAGENVVFWFWEPW